MVWCGCFLSISLLPLALSLVLLPRFYLTLLRTVGRCETHTLEHLLLHHAALVALVRLLAHLLVLRPRVRLALRRAVARDKAFRALVHLLGLDAARLARVSSRARLLLLGLRLRFDFLSQFHQLLFGSLAFGLLSPA